MEGPIRPILDGAMANLSLEATVSVNIRPKYKKYQMDLLNYELKTRDVDISPPKCLTHC